MRDRLWLVEANDLVPRKSNTDPKKSELIRKDAVGQFPIEMVAALEAAPALVTQIAYRLIEAHFPSSLHADVLAAVGLVSSGESLSRRNRDPLFRERILNTYGHRCAVCGLDLRIGDVSVGLEAAHIKWHQAGGPDTVNNRVALCASHHKAFDYGLFRVRPDGILLLSDRATGSGAAFDSLITQVHGVNIRRPHNPSHYPDSEFLSWHQKQVFKGNSRAL